MAAYSSLEDLSDRVSVCYDWINAICNAIFLIVVLTMYFFM